MKIHRFVKKAAVAFAGTLLSLGIAAVPSADAAGYRLIGWNNLGMHCMDADFAVLSLLPPFNTIQAQLIDPSGKLVQSASGIQVTYEAVADPSGSINTTSAGKTNFWDHEDGLFGVNLPVNAGLAGYPMPGAGNVPQAMTFDPAINEFVAYGIPIAPYDDAGRKNTYPMMKLVARDSLGTLLASTSIVLPVSDEMSCKSCHSSGSGPEGRPASGWVNDADPERDFRLNILRLHDDNRRDDARFVSALAEVGYNPKGLEATVVENGRSILCASCHSSEALPGSGLAGIPPLTQSIHTSMASVTDPATGLKLDDTTNRSACYTCHPGSKTRCLRGAMGAAVAGDGSMSMQCQSCHGDMKDVGATTRTGWLEEPRCDSCHTGTATKNNGQIRYTSVFSSPGVIRASVDKTFATNDGAPMEGLSLYRFSKGHGGLECSACHGSTHAEFPSSHDNDNIQSVATQGHKGVIAECRACHATVPSSPTGGPHGLHPIGASWVEDHGDVAEHSGAAACRNCHGSDSRGTVLSRAQADRSFSTDFGTKKFFRGATIGCYACHNGPSSESTNPNRAPVVANAQAATTPLLPVTIPLVATDADGNALTLRVVSQPVHGSVGIAGTKATYYPDGSFLGLDTFTFAAWDGSIDSNLATGTVSTLGVNQPPSVTSATATPNPVTGKTTTLLATATDDRGEAALVYTWSVVTLPSGATVKFSANGTNAAKATVATFSKPGTYGLRVTARDAGGATATRDASVTVLSVVTTVTVSPSSAYVVRGGTKQFAATVKNQFGLAMSPQPAVAWTIGGTNTISSTGLAKAGTTTGTYTVTATTAGKKGTAKLTVTP